MGRSTDASGRCGPPGVVRRYVRVTTSPRCRMERVAPPALPQGPPTARGYGACCARRGPAPSPPRRCSGGCRSRCWASGRCCSWRTVAARTPSPGVVSAAYALGAGRARAAGLSRLVDRLGQRRVLPAALVVERRGDPRARAARRQRRPGVVAGGRRGRDQPGGLRSSGRACVPAGARPSPRSAGPPRCSGPTRGRPSWTRSSSCSGRCSWSSERWSTRPSGSAWRCCCASPAPAGWSRSGPRSRRC